MGTISLAIHVTAAALFVGPQILMFFAVIPATWLIEDNEKLRRQVTRVVAARFGMLAMIAIVLLVVTGVYQYLVLVPASIRRAPDRYAFSNLFDAKMTMFILSLVLIFLHTRLFARKIATLSDQLIALEDQHTAASRESAKVVAIELEQARRKSFNFSLLILAASLITLWLGVALGDPSFAWAQR